MSSQKQWHKVRKIYKAAYKNEALKAENGELHERIAWLRRRPPWWKFWVARKWKGEEPK